MSPDLEWQLLPLLMSYHDRSSEPAISRFSRGIANLSRAHL
jgi:hypothetical protein